jgi:hypothetical protein
MSTTAEPEATITWIAERLVSLHRNEIRFSDGHWWHWHRTRFVPDGNLLYVSRCVERSLKSAAAEARATGDRQTEAIVKGLAANPVALIVIVSEASQHARISRPDGWFERLRIPLRAVPA